MKKLLMLLSAVSCSYLLADDIDCAKIKGLYEKAQMYMKENRPGYTSQAVDMFRAIYDQCKDKSTDQETLGNTVYQIGRAYWHGHGVAKKYPQACNYFNELINKYGDVADHNLVGYSQLFIAAGARNGLCEARNVAKAVLLYKKIIADEKFTTGDIKARAQVRLANAYLNGEGVEQDYAKSYDLFTNILNNDKNIADKSVVAWAKFWIADAHEFGKSVEKDTARARELFTDIVENYKTFNPIAVLHAQDRLQKMEHVGNR